MKIHENRPGMWHNTFMLELQKFKTPLIKMMDKIMYVQTNFTEQGLCEGYVLM